MHHGRRNRALDRTVARAFRALADADLAGDRPSRPIRRALVAQFHRLYYHSRARTWQNTRFLGVDVRKTPLDLWLYQELIHDERPDVVIEAGTEFGGSAYFFARMFDLVGHGEVVTIDVEEQPGRPEHPRITYLSGSSTEPGDLRGGARAARRPQAPDRARRRRTGAATCARSCGSGARSSPSGRTSSSRTRTRAAIR